VSIFDYLGIGIICAAVLAIFFVLFLGSIGSHNAVPRRRPPAARPINFMNNDPYNIGNLGLGNIGKDNNHPKGKPIPPNPKRKY